MKSHWNHARTHRSQATVPARPRQACFTSDSIEGPSRLAWSCCTRPGSAAAPVGAPPLHSPATPRSPPAAPPASPLNGPPCPANGLLPPFFAMVAVAEAHTGEKREENSGTGGRPACRPEPESSRSPLPGGVHAGVLEGVCDGVTVGVGVGVQQGSATADRRATAAVVPRIAAVRSRGRGIGARSGGGGDDQLDREQSGRRKRGMVHGEWSGDTLGFGCIGRFKAQLTYTL